MNANDLLIWMSARAHGSWAQFRSAVEQFQIERVAGVNQDESLDEHIASDLPIYQEVRLVLQRLAHVEFFSSTAGRDWRVVPPILAVQRREGRSSAVLCGARSPAILASLRMLAGPVLYECHGAPGMPDRIVLMASGLNTLAQTANNIGLALQIEAPVSILAAIPPVDDPRSRFPAEPPSNPGWTVERFSTSRLGWEHVEPPDHIQRDTELLRYRMKYQRFYFLRWKGRAFRVQVQVGKYAVLRHRRVRELLSYDRYKATLSMPISCRPPLLIERALVLCSGLLPRFQKESGTLEYTDIPLRIASLAAGLLRQELQLQ